MLNRQLITIEDDILAINTNKSLLGLRDIEYSSFFNVQRAKAHLEAQEAPALILSDNNFKTGMTGIEFARELAKTRPEDRLILLTGLLPDVKLPSNIIAAYTKPVFDINEFLDVIEKNLF